MAEATRAGQVAKEMLDYGGEGKKQGGVEELGSSQSSGTEQGVLVGKCDGLIRLLARQELIDDGMYMLIPVDTCLKD